MSAAHIMAGAPPCHARPSQAQPNASAASMSRHREGHRCRPASHTARTRPQPQHAVAASWVPCRPQRTHVHVGHLAACSRQPLALRHVAADAVLHAEREQAAQAAHVQHAPPAAQAGHREQAAGLERHRCGAASLAPHPTKLAVQLQERQNQRLLQLRRHLGGGPAGSAALDTQGGRKPSTICATLSAARNVPLASRCGHQTQCSQLAARAGSGWRSAGAGSRRRRRWRRWSCRRRRRGLGGRSSTPAKRRAMPRCSYNGRRHQMLRAGLLAALQKRSLRGPWASEQPSYAIKYAETSEIEREWRFLRNAATRCAS